MVGLVLGSFAVERVEELFGELEFRHVGFCASLLFQAPENLRKTSEGQVGGRKAGGGSSLRTAGKGGGVCTSERAWPAVEQCDAEQLCDSEMQTILLVLQQAQAMVVYKVQRTV